MRKFNFDVDSDYASKNNELLKDTGRLKAAAVLLAVIQIAIGIGIYFYLNGDTFGKIVLGLFIIAALFSLSMIFIIPKQVGTAQDLYEKYELVPAIVAKVNPRDVILLALVNLNVDPEASPNYGLATRTVTKLGIQKTTAGTRVPSVAVSGRRSARTSGQWDEISPMPIAWATQDPAVIKAAEKEIPHQLWQKLESNKGKVDEVLKTKYNLLPLN